MPHPSRSTVVHVTRYVPQYRREVFESLRFRLAARDVDFRLVYGQPGPDDAARGDAVEIAWAERIENRFIALPGREAVWQPYLRRVSGADLLILEQGSRLLATYAAFGRRAFGGPAIAFWGHGLHFNTGHAMPVAEAAKAWLARRADWWFAYTPRSVEVVAGLGFPRERITLMENAVDTSALRAARARLDEDELEALRTRLGLVGRRVAVYVGALTPEKRLGFLIAAGDEVCRRVPDFELIVVGAGVEAARLRAAAVRRPWLHAVGARFGDDKVRHLALGRIMLMPGRAGLVVLDAFALELPMVTTAWPYHSHEFGYLVDRVNARVVPSWDDTGAYAAVVAELLEDDALQERLREGCSAGATRYTVENMADNIVTGCLAALSTLGRC